MTATSRPLTAAITLEPCSAQVFDDAFLGTTGPCPWPKAYGGDMVSQACVAMMRTTTQDRQLHSLHSYFMRPVDIGAHVRYEVERLRDGRGYSTRQVRGYQHNKVVFMATGSFHIGESGREYAAPPPRNIPEPHDLPSSAKYLQDITPGTAAAGQLTPAAKEYWCEGRSFDMRHIPGPVYVQVEGHQEPQQALWIKPFDALRTVPGLSENQLATAALSYCCDYTILEPILRALGVSWMDDNVVTASLDHAMWFHRLDYDPNEWLLFTQEAAEAASGRGLGIGRFFTRDGSHIATVAQEGLLRLG